MKFLSLPIVCLMVLAVPLLASGSESHVTSSVTPVHAKDKGDSDVKESWDNATVYVPGKFMPTTPHKISVEKPLPIVIYLHGCTGIASENQSWGDYFKELGYIAVLPDSMARRSITNCDPKTKRSGYYPQAHAMRQEEIRYALEQVRNSPWADGKNVFLMGHSEGGVAAARTKLEGFSGIIISGWRCTHKKNPGFDGIFAPVDTPILTLEWNRDDWATKATTGSCADKFGERKNARQVLFPGSGHSVFDQREAREAVAKFLMENLQRDKKNKRIK